MSSGAAVESGLPGGTGPGGVSPLEVSDVHKVYSGGGGDLHVLRGVEMRLHPGEALAVIGASGAGKSTLLHLLGGLDLPTRGTVRIGGTPLSALERDELAAVRNRHIGFVFQFHHLLREFSALENVMIPCLVAGRDRRFARDRARELLAEVGLSAREDHRPAQLSGGEQQRVAVARALANDPVVLLADEPTGNLDHHTSERLHELLFRMREERGLAMVLVTHNPALAYRADRILKLEEGVVLPLEAGETVPGWYGPAPGTEGEETHEV